jgi:hypothetical protein
MEKRSGGREHDENSQRMNKKVSEEGLKIDSDFLWKRINVHGQKP